MNKVEVEFNTSLDIGCIICGICSFFLPGLGQLLQGRVCTFFVHFTVAVIIGLITVGIFWIPMALYSAYNAATYSKQVIAKNLEQ